MEVQIQPPYLSRLPSFLFYTYCTVSSFWRFGFMFRIKKGGLASEGGWRKLTLWQLLFHSNNEPSAVLNHCLFFLYKARPRDGGESAQQHPPCNAFCLCMWASLVELLLCLMAIFSLSSSVCFLHIRKDICWWIVSSFFMVCSSRKSLIHNSWWHSNPCGVSFH